MQDGTLPISSERMGSTRGRSSIGSLPLSKEVSKEKMVHWKDSKLHINVD